MLHSGCCDEVLLALARREFCALGLLQLQEPQGLTMPPFRGSPGILEGQSCSSVQAAVQLGCRLDCTTEIMCCVLFFLVLSC